MQVILESQAVNYLKNRKELYSEIKEISSKVRGGERIYGRIVRVGPATHLVSFS
jgi:hypothetical protein